MKSSSIYSKLTVLVAKLYKAEKLYASMRRPPSGLNTNKSSSLSGASRLKPKSVKLSGYDQKDGSANSTNSFSSGILIEHANEIRSLEWYEVHHQFRVKLNKLVSKGNTNNLVIELNHLWHEFCEEFQLAENLLKESKQMALNAIGREEYAHLLKLSSDLIQRKARIQALKVIHDELEQLISHNKSSNFNLLDNDKNKAKSKMDDSSDNSFSNVIPFTRKAAF